MCQNCCQKPDKLIDSPQECTPEQIRECHGEQTGHPCTSDQDDTQAEAGSAG